MATEAQKRAWAKYAQKSVVQISLKLNRGTDADIIDILENQESRNGYIKYCIREQIKREKRKR